MDKKANNQFVTPPPGASVYDVAIIGGGLAGLSLAIQLAKENYEVIVLEKETYPFHKVCGEYISLESWNFLEHLGYPLSDMELPIIKHLTVSSPNGNTIDHALSLGGFGISRYKIDAELALLARSVGVVVMEGIKVNDVLFSNDLFEVFCAAISFKARVAAGSFGKRSNLDIKWKRQFTEQRTGKLNNYIGVKYHIKTPFPADTIALHNFSDGYCGISRIENDTCCFCYLTTAANLKKSGNSIAAMEKNILHKNPYLKNIFATAEFLWKEPVTIAQVSFTKKQQVENHVLMIGDAAGMITPLCGNGMSMALHGSRLAAGLVMQFLHGDISRKAMEMQYKHQWKKAFGNRLRAGRLIQRMFGKCRTTNIFVALLKPFPRMVSLLVRQTHGGPF
jgi:menaquinone-9 beta-reductase